jgi:hypothetical protein
MAKPGEGASDSQRCEARTLIGAALPLLAWCGKRAPESVRHFDRRSGPEARLGAPGRHRGSLALGGDTIVFTLPQGYQPARARAFKLTVDPETTNATLLIYSRYVQIIQNAGYTGNEVYSLDGVSFLAAQ